MIFNFFGLNLGDQSLLFLTNLKKEKAYFSFLILTSLSLSSSLSYGWDIPSTPTQNHAGQTKQPTDLTQFAEVTQSESNLSPTRVRIPLTLRPYRKLVYAAQNGQTKVKYKRDKEIKHTLRARLDRVNHFFLSEYHIESTPLSWKKETRKYKLRLTVYKRYGAYGKIEESIGQIDVAGFLTGKTNLFVLNGLAEKKFIDKNSNPIVDIIAGYGGRLASAKRSGKIDQKSKRPNQIIGNPVNNILDTVINQQPSSPLAARASIRSYRVGQQGNKLSSKNNKRTSLKKKKPQLAPKPTGIPYAKPTVKTRQNAWSRGM
jgi:hypothetical protein